MRKKGSTVSMVYFYSPYIKQLSMHFCYSYHFCYFIPNFVTKKDNQFQSHYSASYLLSRLRYCSVHLLLPCYSVEELIGDLQHLTLDTEFAISTGKFTLIRTAQASGKSHIMCRYNFFQDISALFTLKYILRNPTTQV